MDILKQAIIAAGHELIENHGWSIEDDKGKNVPEDGEFVNVLYDHIINLLDMEAVKQARIKALQEELASLTGA